MHRAAIVSAAVAPVALIGGWTIAETQQASGYDAIRNTISALAAQSASDRWIMTTALLLLGLCHMVTAGCITEAATVGRVLLAAGGLATIVVAAAAQPAAAHTPAATFAFVALALWPVAAGIPTRRIALLATVVLLGLLSWLAVELHGGLLGLSERFVAGAQALWPLAVVLTIAAARRAADIDPPASEPVAQTVDDVAPVRVVHRPIERGGPEPGRQRDPSVSEGP